MEFAFAAIGFFIFVTMIFVAVAFFFPEWVGITGKKAKEYQEQHQEGSNTPEKEI